jgi:tetratricopeptide (TPR) repeat protein
MIPGNSTYGSAGRDIVFRTKISCAVFAIAALAIAAAPARAQLGSITFPTSGAAAAQPAFLEGVKELYSFQFDEARVAFQKAEQIDPKFAMAYWGEAMSHNHPLWAEVDVPAARAALEKIAPDPATLESKGGTEKEKAYLAAAHELFYAPGDKLARDNAYCDAMANMYSRWPNDEEVEVFYALSLLGTVRPGDTGFRRQALAAAICLHVFQENPNHPGAAHFIIHAFDDPDHAILALPAARAYAKIAPSAAHALHMPSHIFLRLGMWQDVVDSNAVAYQSARALEQRMNLPEGREDFHTLSWLEYGNIMLGRTADAEKNLEWAKEAVDRNPGNRGVLAGYLGMRARYILETGKWEMASQTGVNEAIGSGGGSSYEANDDTWVFITGMAAAKRVDFSGADNCVQQMRAIRQRVESSDAYAAKPYAIMENELASQAEFARGHKDEALQLAKKAADIDVTLAPPSGPPDPIKPALEFYAEMLAATGKQAEAAAIFEKQLLRTPNRTPSVKELAAIKGLSGTAKVAGS